MFLDGLRDALRSVLRRFKSLKDIKTWKIWSEIKNAYERWKRWRDWYKTHVQTYIDSIRKLQRQIYQQFFLPVLKIIDTLRRMSQIVGIFSPKLAAKLNSIFFRIEGALLAPLRAWQARINGLGHIMQAILTPLGYFDRATLLNSLWRDAKYLRVLARNPLAGPVTVPKVPAVPTTAENVQFVKDHTAGVKPPDSANLDADLDRFRTLIASGAELPNA
jgi:hypothetical protein